MKLTLKEKVRGMFLGIAIGDQLGSQFELKNKEDIAEMTDPLENGIINYYGESTWTDDTQLTLAVAEGIINCHKLSNINNFMESQVKSFIKSHKEKGQKGWGGTTRKALNNLLEGKSWQESAPVERNDGFGNGTAMKISPLSASYISDVSGHYYLFNHIISLSEMTHFRSISSSAALAMFSAYNYCLKKNIDDFIIYDFVGDIVGASAYGYRSKFGDITDNLPKRLCELIEWKNFNDERLIKEYRGGCYCYESIPFSLMLFVRHLLSIESIYECIYAGGDCDSNASMIGGLLGALHGEKIFPENLINNLYKKEEILDVAERLCKKLKIK